MLKTFKSAFLKLSLFILICIFLFFIIQIGSYMLLSKKTYEIPEQTCIGLFGVEPSAFADQPDRFTSWTNDFCLYSRVNSKGNLILTLSEKQQENWRVYYAKPIQTFKNQYGITISKDYSEVIYSHDFIFQTIDLEDILLAHRGLYVTQLLNGKNPEKMYIRFIELDEKGKIKQQADWPNEEFNIGAIATRGRF